MRKLLMGATAAAVVAGSVALGARPASADDESVLTAMLGTLVAIEAQLVRIERNTRALAESNP